MSGPRRLWIRFRHVESGRDGAYREAVVEADRLAVGLGAHFWAFETDTRRGLMVEFLEGPSDVALSALADQSETFLAAGAGVTGRPNATVEAAFGPEGVRCSEFGEQT